MANVHLACLLSALRERKRAKHVFRVPPVRLVSSGIDMVEQRSGMHRDVNSRWSSQRCFLSVIRPAARFPYSDNRARGDDARAGAGCRGPRSPGPVATRERRPSPLVGHTHTVQVYHQLPINFIYKISTRSQTDTTASTDRHPVKQQ